MCWIFGFKVAVDFSQKKGLNVSRKLYREEDMCCDPVGLLQTRFRASGPKEAKIREKFRFRPPEALARK